MGIKLQTRTPLKASMKLLNHINTYMFEQEFDEIKSFNPVLRQKLKASLKEVSRLLSEGIKESKK